MANGTMSSDLMSLGVISGNRIILLIPLFIYGALIGTIANATNKPLLPTSQWFAIGTSRTITADRAGELVLLFDDGIYQSQWTPIYLDNAGGFSVTVHPC